MKRFLVVGLGRFGRAVAEGLTEAGGEVIGLDTRMPLVDAVRDRIAVAAQVDSVDLEALRAAGARDVDAAVVAIGEDFEAVVLTVAIVKELGIKEIVARAQDERQRKILELVGATRIVFVEREMGERLAKALAASHVVDHVKIAEGLALIHWTADERVAGRPLGESELRSRWDLHVLAVKRPRGDGEEAVTMMPEAGFVPQAGDVLLLVGADARLKAFTK